MIGQYPSFGAFEDGRRQRLTISGGGVQVDAIAVMGGVPHRRVAVHDHLGVRRGIVVEFVPDPQKVFFGLLVQRHTRTDARVNEHEISDRMGQFQTFKEGHM